MKYIPSYRTKRDNSMIYRITCNVFFVHLSSVWKAQINIHILHHVTVSQALLHAYVSSGSPGGQDGPFLPAILQVMWHLDPLWLAKLHTWGHCSCRTPAETGESTNRSEFCRLWGIDKLIFWSHYVLKQLVGRLLLCSIHHIMLNCLRNANCWKVSPLSGTWCELCFVNTGANHV